ncbi:MAG: hypothetical protein ACJAWL_001248 [Motiliproteus sp.]|jgi:hypothetical protein
MVETRELVIAFIAAGGAVFGVVGVLITITIAFKYIEEVERQIATPGKQLDMIRSFHRGGIAGRWMRALHVFGFFMFRKIPRYGPTISSRMGDEVVPISRSLTLWATLPVGLVGLFGIIFFVAGSLL